MLVVCLCCERFLCTTLFKGVCHFYFYNHIVCCFVSLPGLAAAIRLRCSQFSLHATNTKAEWTRSKFVRMKMMITKMISPIHESSSVYTLVWISEFWIFSSGPHSCQAELSGSNCKVLGTARVKDSIPSCGKKDFGPLSTQQGSESWVFDSYVQVWCSIETIGIKSMTDRLQQTLLYIRGVLIIFSTKFWLAGVLCTGESVSMWR